MTPRPRSGRVPVVAWPTIVKSAADLRLPPNLSRVESVPAGRVLGAQPAQRSTGCPAEDLNIAHEAVDRHRDRASLRSLAFRWLRRNGRATGDDLRRARATLEPLCNALDSLGDRQGRRRGRAGRSDPGALRGGPRHPEEPERVLSPLLCLRAGAATDASMRSAERRVLAHNRAPLRAQGGGSPRFAARPRARHLVGEGGRADRRCPGTLDYVELIGCVGRRVHDFARPIPRIRPSSTSRAVRRARQREQSTYTRRWWRTMRLDALRSICTREDVFWCTADPGWVTGTSYGIIAPLTNGITSIVDEGDFDAERWYGILESEQRVGLVHGADGDPDDDEGRHRACPEHTATRRSVCSQASASRSTPRESSGAARRSASRSTTTGGRRRRAGS